MKHSVKEYKLPSGAQGLVVQVPGTDIVNLVIRFNSGFQFGSAESYEIPHLMEHLIGCGCKSYPGPNQFKIEIEKNGAYRNAYTSSVVNGYVVECAAFELERVLDLVDDYLTQPLFPEEAFATEVSNVREELTRNTTQHGSACSMELNARAFPREDKRYEERIEQLPSLTRDQALKHYESTHTSVNARFYVAGSFADDGQAVVARLERLLAKLPRGERRQPLGQPGKGQKKVIVTHRDIPQIYYRQALYAGGLDWAGRNALLCLRMLLTGGYSSRVYGEARRRGLAYHVDGVAGMGPEGSQFGFLGYVTPGNVAELFKLMATEYRAIRRGEVKPEQLAAAQDLLVGSSLRAHQTAGDMLGWYLGPYDREEIILDFEELHTQLRQVKVEAVVEQANRLAAAGAHGVSILGNVTKAQAEEYAAYLAPMWEPV
jgi:predicted Zn-dependent peptidase